MDQANILYSEKDKKIKGIKKKNSKNLLYANIEYFLKYS